MQPKDQISKPNVGLKSGLLQVFIYSNEAYLAATLPNPYFVLRSVVFSLEITWDIPKSKTKKSWF